MADTFHEDDEANTNTNANTTIRQLGLPESFSNYLDEMERDESKQQEQYDVLCPSEPFQQALLEQFESAHYLAYELGRLEQFFTALDMRLHNNDMGFVHRSDDAVIYPAVDLESGVGVFPIEYAKHFCVRDEELISLQWYATETLQPLPPNQVHNNKLEKEGTTNRLPKTRLEELQAAFTYFIETDNDGELVGQDKHGLALYVNDKVQLEGLSREGYNGRKGHVTGKDGKDPERIGVQLQTKDLPISVKPVNLQRIEVQTALPYEEAVQMDDDRFMLRDLRSRTCALDARDKETWSNVESIHGKCVVVTCTNLQPIPRDEDDENDAKVEQEELRCTLSPQPWKSVLELADLLLTPGGYLLQYDVAQYDFGSTLVMNDYVASHSLGLQLVECCEPIVYKNPQAGQVFLLLWQKQ